WWCASSARSRPPCAWDRRASGWSSSATSRSGPRPRSSPPSSPPSCPGSPSWCASVPAASPFSTLWATRSRQRRPFFRHYQS
ncbi:MAG: hypothetical protein AVDCRST_MAG08-3892, partial [uncultured Acetobacteraceae bacterium]